MQKNLYYFLIVIGVIGIIDLITGHGGIQGGIITTFLAQTLGSLVAAYFSVYVAGFGWIFLILAWFIRRDMKSKAL